MVTEDLALPFLTEIATAPGDLPITEIARRIRTGKVAFRHYNALHPAAPVPDAPVQVDAECGDALALASARIHYTTDGSAPTEHSPWVSMHPHDTSWHLLAGYLTGWSGQIPGQPEGTVVRYRIAGRRFGEEEPVWAHDGQGFWFQYPDERGISTFAYRVETPRDPLPAWVRDAVIYQIFLDRFRRDGQDGVWEENSDPQGIHGGTLRGVEEALPYLQDLGVTCLWLTPITTSPSYHRYDTTDYFTVDPRLGSNEDLRALVQAAHAREMRVLLDFVPSHTSWEHPAFSEARERADAPTASWFTFDERPDRYRMFLSAVPSLPSINTDDPGARRHLIDSAVQWVREYGVDGFRIDHAIGAGSDFFIALRDALQRLSPDVFTVGEITDSPDSLRRYRGKVDAALDFPLAGALRSTFGSGEWSVEQLAAFLDAYDRFMAEGPGRLSFLDNHDMNRIGLVAGGDVRKVKLAALCLMTLPPTPVIYYGTEIGLAQEFDMRDVPFGGDVAVRADMPWDPSQWDDELHSVYRALVTLRREHPALRHGRRETVHVDDAAGALLYRCTDHAGADALLVAFNLGPAPISIPLPVAVAAPNVRFRVGDVEVDGAAVALESSSGAVLAP